MADPVVPLPEQPAAEWDIGDPEHCNVRNPQNGAPCKLAPTVDAHKRHQGAALVHVGTHKGDVTRWKVGVR